MDTLFRLVSLQSSDQQSYNSSRTSSSSRSSSKPNTNNNSSNNNSNSNNYNNNNNNNSNNNSNNCNNNNSSSSYYYYYHHQAAGVDAYQEECGNAPHFYMDEDFSSSSSSKQLHAYNPQNPSTTTAATTTTATTAPSTSSTAHLLFDPAEFTSLPPDLNLDFSSPTTSASGGGGGGAGGGGGGRWAAQLLMECARAVEARDSGRVQQLMWMLNELSSAYGDPEQKIAAYFLQGLFARLTASGPRTLRTLSSAADRAASFESTRRTALRFQELSPWSSFGHVAANGAILEAFLEGGAQRLHILDLSSTFCTQWPTLLEALATRSADDTPHLTITTVVPPALQRVMREIGQRMEKFARLMGVPFRFAAVHPPPSSSSSAAAAAGGLADLDLDSLDLRAEGAVLAVNFVGALRGVSPASRRRDAFLAAIRRLEPRIVTVVEEEADLSDEAGESSSSSAAEEGAFVRVFKDALRFFSAYFDSLEESFPKTSNERLALERAAGRAVVDLVACPAEGSAERRERAAAWSLRLRAAGFAPAAFSDDVADDVRSLLRRYREGWSMKDADDAGIFLAWKDQPVVWASAWRPS